MITIQVAFKECFITQKIKHTVTTKRESATPVQVTKQV